METIDYTENTEEPVDEMKNLFDFGVFNYMPHVNDEIVFAYLDYVTKPTTEEIHGTPVTRMHLETKTKKYQVDKISEYLNTKDQNEYDCIYNHICEKAFGILKKRAYENRDVFNSKYTIDLEIHKNGSGRVSSSSILLRILAISNMISREHDAQFRTNLNIEENVFILVNKDVYKLLMFDNAKDPYFFTPKADINGIKVFISPVGDDIIVGKYMQPACISIHCDSLKNTDYKLSDDNEIEEIEGVNINYSITEVGDFSPYVAFKVIYK